VSLFSLDCEWRIGGLPVRPRRRRLVSATFFSGRGPIRRRQLESGRPTRFLMRSDVIPGPAGRLGHLTHSDDVNVNAMLSRSSSNTGIIPNVLEQSSCTGSGTNFGRRGMNIYDWLIYLDIYCYIPHLRDSTSHCFVMCMQTCQVQNDYDEIMTRISYECITKLILYSSYFLIQLSIRGVSLLGLVGVSPSPAKSAYPHMVTVSYFWPRACCRAHKCWQHGKIMDQYIVIGTL